VHPWDLKVREDTDGAIGTAPPMAIRATLPTAKAANESVAGTTAIGEKVKKALTVSASVVVAISKRVRLRRAMAAEAAPAKRKALVLLLFLCQQQHL